MPTNAPSRIAIVADAGPLITLEKVRGGFSVLPALFGRLIVPWQVLEEVEVSRIHPGEAAYLAALGLPVEVADPGELLAVPSRLTVDLGERAAVTLAVRRKVGVLLEDRAPRTWCDELGVPYIGAGGSWSPPPTADPSPRTGRSGWWRRCGKPNAWTR